MRKTRQRSLKAFLMTVLLMIASVGALAIGPDIALAGAQVLLATSEPYTQEVVKLTLPDETVNWQADSTVDGSGAGDLDGIQVNYTTVKVWNAGTFLDVDWGKIPATNDAVESGVTYKNAGILGADARINPTQEQTITFDSNIENPLLLVNWTTEQMSFDFGDLDVELLDSNPTTLANNVITCPGSANTANDGFAVRIKGVFGPENPLTFDMTSTSSFQSVGFTLSAKKAVMAQTGEIQGIKWNDLNGDGIRQESEPALSEVKIYLDLNENRVFDPGEPSQITDAKGQYRFTGLQPDTYIVREVVPTGFSQTYPKPPKDENGATTEGSLQMIKPNPAVAATFIGNAGISTDGLGTTGSGTIQAEVPAGSTVEYAFLHIATRQIQPGQIGFDGQGVSISWLNNAEPGPFQFKTGRADVTGIVANKVGSSGGTFNFTVDETVTGNPGNVEGTSLTVIYSNPELPERTILVLEGGLTGPTPKTNILYLNEPLDPTIPGFTAQMALGIQFGVLNGTQYSMIDVNGKRLTSSAGDYDDGSGSNGQLVTVGGVGDTLSNPVNSVSTTDKSDDELYDLTPFLTKGDASIRLDTANPSNDDSIFLVAVMFPGAASAEERGFYEVDISEGTIASDINFANLLTGNVPPIAVNSIPDQTAKTTEAFSFTVASDSFSDANGDNLTLSATQENGDRLPAWLNFNPHTGTFSGTPPESAVGTISIKVTANDGHGGTQSDSFNLTVLPGNKAPVVVNPIADQATTTGDDFSFTVGGDTFSDPDGDSLTRSATLENGEPLPDWLTFDPATGTFSGTPAAGDNGAIAIKVTADDGKGGVVSDTFNLVVNGAPVVSNAIADQATTTGDDFSFTVGGDTFSDPDGDSLTRSATLENGEPLPDWLTFDPATGTFSGTPAAGDNGTIAIQVTADDGKGGVVSDTFNLVVNGAPVVVNPIADQTATAGKDISFPVPGDTFSDPDGDSLTRSATLKNGDPLPDWLTFNPATGEFAATPGNGDISSICITVTANDGRGGVTSDTFNAIVQSVLAEKETFINPDNGHIYFLTEALSWTEARAEAEAVDGNLVTINDLEENDWLWGTFGTAEPFWIGLNDAAEEGTFEWVSGQDPDIYFDDYWSSTQPDSGYYGGEEKDYVVMNWRDDNDPSGGWGDVENAGPGYGEAVPGIVEVEPETLDYDLTVLKPEPKDCQ